MEKISQLICFFVFLVLVATSCMAGTAENQTEVDVHARRQLRAVDSQRTCFNVTIEPSACGSSCNLTYYRYQNGAGVGILALSAAISSGSEPTTSTVIYNIQGITSASYATFFANTYMKNGTIPTKPASCWSSSCYPACETLTRVKLIGVQGSYITQVHAVNVLKAVLGTEVLKGCTTLAFGTLSTGAIAYQGPIAGSNGGSVPFKNTASGGLNIGICVPVTVAGK